MSMVKKTFHALTKPNTDPVGGKIVPRSINGFTGFTIGAGIFLASSKNTSLKEHNANKLGRVGYLDGSVRMTNSYTSGAVESMKRASRGNYGVFADMAEEVVDSRGNFVANVLDDYGANGELISALYNMGGR